MAANPEGRKTVLTPPKCDSNVWDLLQHLGDTRRRFAAYFPCMPLRRQRLQQPLNCALVGDGVTATVKSPQQLRPFSPPALALVDVQEVDDDVLRPH